MCTALPLLSTRNTDVHHLTIFPYKRYRCVLLCLFSIIGNANIYHVSHIQEKTELWTWKSTCLYCVLTSGLQLVSRKKKKTRIFFKKLGLPGVLVSTQFWSAQHLGDGGSWISVILKLAWSTL